MTTGLSRGGEERGKYACTQPLSVWRAPTLDERWLRLMPLAAYWLLPANQGQVFLQSSARKNYSDSSNVFLSVNPKTGFKSCNGFCVPFGKSKSGFLMFWILFEKGFIEFEIRRIRIQINGLVIYAVPFRVQAVASMRQDESVASSWFWPFFFWRNFKPGPEQAWLARLNGLALAYIHKPTEIDSSYVLKRRDTSGHRRIALAFSKE